MPDAEDNPLLDFGDSVFSHRDALAESYEPERILERDEEIDQYAAALRPVVEGDTPDNIMVYGDTGAGKTTVTRYMTTFLECDARTGQQALRRVVAERNGGLRG